MRFDISLCDSLSRCGCLQLDFGRRCDCEQATDLGPDLESRVGRGRVKYVRAATASGSELLHKFDTSHIVWRPDVQGVNDTVNATGLCQTALGIAGIAVAYHEQVPWLD